MKIFKNFDEIEDIKNPVVTTGSFDGVHTAHKIIINRLKKIATEINGETVLITFCPHPRKILYPNTQGKNLKLINSLQEKIYLLEKIGLDNLIIVDFSIEFSQISSQDFIKDFLIGKLKVKKIIAGFNHHFGNNRQGNYQYLNKIKKQYDFATEEVSQQLVANESISSTQIKKAICEGKIKKANEYLGHEYIIIGTTEDDKEKSTNFECKKINVETTEKLIPPNGKYITTLKIGNVSYKCITKINFSPNLKKVEIKIFFTEKDIANGVSILFFHKKENK